MKKLTIFLVISILFFSCSKTSEHKAETQKEPKTEKKAATDLEVISYRLGFNGVLITLEDFPDVDQEAMARDQKIILPRPKDLQPNPDLLDRRYQRFRSAG